nr:MAG TPA: endonuclease [Caudoviricetes sp.]
MQAKESSKKSGCQRDESVSLRSARSLKRGRMAAHCSPISPATAECQGEPLSTKKKSSKTLVQVTTSNNQFYDDACSEISSHLLSPTEIDSSVSDLSCLNSSSRGVEVKSWFLANQRIATSVNSRKIYSQYFKTSRSEGLDLSVTQIKRRRIRIYPNNEQRTILRRWFGVQRLVYNQAIQHYNDKEFDVRHWMKLYDYISSELDMDYVKEVPYQIKKIAVKDAYTSWSTNCKKAKKSGKPFSLRFKSRKDKVQSCSIPKVAVSTLGIYHTISGRMKFSETDWFAKSEISDSRLICDHGRWFVSIPRKITTQSTSETQGGAVAVDPGIRNFGTYFSTDGRFGWVGQRAFERILKLNLRIDKIKSIIAKTEDKLYKFRLRRSIDRLYHKIRDLVDELHWKFINFLTKEFYVVIFPPFNVSDMVKTSGRKIRKVVVRSMMSLRFYEFKERLKKKCKERHVLFIEQNEAWTSKTNSFNGEVMTNIGSREFFTYQGLRINRDVNGSRNILLRAMRDSSANS